MKDNHINICSSCNATTHLFLDYRASYPVHSKNHPCAICGLTYTIGQTRLCELDGYMPLIAIGTLGYVRIFK